jgi:hypothetical protein
VRIIICQSYCLIVGNTGCYSACHNRTLGSGTTENHVAISENTCANYRIAVTNTSKLYQAIYSVCISTHNLFCPSVKRLQEDFIRPMLTAELTRVAYSPTQETRKPIQRVASQLEVSKIPYHPTDPILPFSYCYCCDGV